MFPLSNLPEQIKSEKDFKKDLSYHKKLIPILAQYAVLGFFVLCLLLIFYGLFVRFVWDVKFRENILDTLLNNAPALLIGVLTMLGFQKKKE